MSDKEPNGRFEWLRADMQALRGEITAMEARLTARINSMEQTVTTRLNSHSADIKALQSAKDQAVGAQKYKRWLIVTAFGLVGAIGTVVGLAAQLRG